MALRPFTLHTAAVCLTSCLALLGTGRIALAAPHTPVLMISIDGMRPDYVTHADEHGLRIPHLRQFLTSGAYATGVRGIYPTVTYPSHTTLVTGVWPAQHGIVNNLVFDPEHRFEGAWYWYADQIKVPTLWDAAHEAGIRTGSVSWPVTVDSKSIDDDLPEFWRSDVSGEHPNPEDRLLMDAVSRPDRSLAEMESRLGPYMAGNDTSIGGDRTRTTFAVDLLRRHHPGFMTVHLSSLDEAEHLHAPFSPEANADLEQIDALVGELIDAAHAANAATTVVIVSDHGFAPIHDAVNLYIPFIQAGLMTMGKPGYGSAEPVVSSWTAEPWLAGGMAAVMLHDPSGPDATATRAKVKQLLDTLAADPSNGTDRIVPGDQLPALGAFPGAAFLILMRVGSATGTAFSGPLLTPTPGRGTHGFAPDNPEMYASFLAMGPLVLRGKDLGLIDMRQIAPTVANLLGVSLPGADAKPLTLNASTRP